MKLLQWFRLRGKPLYEYGICRNNLARRNRLTGEVQFVLWQAGEQGHAEDYWHKFGDGWEKQFKPHGIKGTSMTKDEAMRLAFKQAFQLGQDYWYQADHDSPRQNKKSDETLAQFCQLVDQTCEALAEQPAQPKQEPVYKYCDDGKVIFTNPEILSQRPNKENT